MIFDISDASFLRIMNMSSLDLPIRWTGGDFYSELGELYKRYLLAVEKIVPVKDFRLINLICEHIQKTVSDYLDGYTFKAYLSFSKAMDILYSNPLMIYNKSNFGKTFDPRYDLALYRVRYIQGNALLEKKRIFHAPKSMCAKIPTYRYSISGSPSLYLGTTIELCCEETQAIRFSDQVIASRFEMSDYNDEEELIAIKVLDLAIKPVDFVKMKQDRNIGEIRHRNYHLNNTETKCNYLMWYPLIAGCSFMRADKSDPFAVEYVLPQFFMQWIRAKYLENELIGIRYFSCASQRASRMGYNYVFPVSGKWKNPDNEFCNVLTKVFKFTEPRYLKEYESTSKLEQNLNRLVASRLD